MAIKDKDGTVYKLRGPNPIMTAQKKWDESKIVYYNMEKWTPIKDVDEKIQSIKPVLEPTKLEIPPIVHKEPEPERISIEPNQTVDRVAKILAEKKIVFHCLLVTVKHFEDDFYGESNSRTVFGQKFDFPGILVKLDDLQIILWTDVEIKEGSIIFPSKMEMKRWWKIQEITPKSGGHLYSAIPSDVSPDFS